MNNITKIAIIGAGPAGTIFYDLLVKSKKYTPNDILLLDKNGDICTSLLKYNTFVENSKSKCPTELGFLVNGKVTGKELHTYFKNKYHPSLICFNLKEINKTESGLFELNSTELSILTENVILSTGIKRKLLPGAIFGGDRDKYDLTFKKFTEFQKIDFKNNEVIFIGSGDNVLFKSHRLAEWIVTNAVPHNLGCIKIFIKNFFKNDNNPNFYKNALKYIDSGVIVVISDFWEIKTINTNKYGLVSEVELVDRKYKSTFPKGAYLSIHTGNIIKTPKLNGCKLDDLILVGDLSLFNNGQVCSIYDAILDTERKVFSFIKNHG